MPTEVTPLSPIEQILFQKWISDNKIGDLDHPDSHYDYRGFFQKEGPKSVKFGVDHFTDQFKQHGHPTFSRESQYSRGPSDGGMWVGNENTYGYGNVKLGPDTFLAQPKMAISHQQDLLHTLLGR